MKNVKVLSEEYGITTIETAPCIMCRRVSKVEVPTDGYYRWINGELIQYSFPHLPVGQRELLISGTHDECWNNLYPEEND